MELTKVKSFCLNYSRVFRNLTKSPWHRIRHFGARWILKISQVWLIALSMVWNLKLKKSNHTDYWSPFVAAPSKKSTFLQHSQNTRPNDRHTFGYVSRVEAFFNIFKLGLAKRGKLYSEALPIKIQLRVPSIIFCSETVWHRSASVCGELLKFSDFTYFAGRLKRTVSFCGGLQSAYSIHKGESRAVNICESEVDSRVIPV